jgi:hypothetical protein
LNSSLLFRTNQQNMDLVLPKGRLQPLPEEDVMPERAVLGAWLGFRPGARAD